MDFAPVLKKFEPRDTPIDQRMSDTTATAGGSPDEPESRLSFKELAEEFRFLGEWDDQCEYLMDLGFELPQLAESQKVEDNRVHGCQSNVWLVADVDGGADEPRVHFLANSDSMFVNGLIVVVRAIYNGRTAEEILALDPKAKLAELGMDRHLSPQRKNGLFGMVERVRGVAAAAL